MKKIIAVSLLVVAMAALLLGCGQAKLTSQEVKGGVTSLQMDLPFTLEQQPKEETAKSNDYVKSITDSRITQAKGMDFHLMQFTTYVMNADKLKNDAASKATFEQKALDGYLTAFEQNAKARESSRDTKSITISGKDARTKSSRSSSCHCLRSTGSLPSPIRKNTRTIRENLPTRSSAASSSGNDCRKKLLESGIFQIS